MISAKIKWWVIATLGVALALTSWKLDRSLHTIGELRHGIAQAKEANAANVAHLGLLRSRIVMMVEQREADRAAADRAIAESRAQRGLLAASLEAERRLREEIYANDERAAAWSVQPVPDDIDQRLRRNRSDRQD